jgi:hypothetical protein
MTKQAVDLDYIEDPNGHRLGRGLVGQQDRLGTEKELGVVPTRC